MTTAADQGVASALEAVLSDNARRVYGAQWRLFTDWCGDVGLMALPVEPLTGGPLPGRPPAPALPPSAWPPPPSPRPPVPRQLGILQWPQRTGRRCGTCKLPTASAENGLMQGVVQAGLPAWAPFRKCSTR